MTEGRRQIASKTKDIMDIKRFEAREAAAERGGEGDEKKIKNQNAKIKNVEPLRGGYFRFKLQHRRDFSGLQYHLAAESILVYAYILM